MSILKEKNQEFRDSILLARTILLHQTVVTSSHELKRSGQCTTVLGVNPTVA